MRISTQTTFLLAVMLCACVSEPSGNQPPELRTYRLGNKGQVVLRAPVANGSSSAEYSAVFNKDELRRFLGVKRLPLSKEAMDLLDKNSCKPGIGGKPFSIEIDGGIDHDILNMEKRQSAKDYYWHSDSPTIRYGLIDKGFPRWAGGEKGWSHDLFPENNKRTFGMIIRCGFNSRNNALINCYVSRDVNKVISIKYLICSDLLSYLKEIDNLYFDFVRKAIVTPKLTSNYRYKG